MRHDASDFRPKLFNGIFLLGFTLFFATWIFIVALGSFWAAMPLLVPLLPLLILCLANLLNALSQSITLDDVCIYCRNGQTNYSLRYDEIEQIRVSRGEAFDGQAQIYLRLIARNESENANWNLSDYGLTLVLRVAVAVEKRAQVNSVAVTLHCAREKELRAMTRKLGTLTLLPAPKIEEEKSKNWFATFLLTPHR